MILTCTTVQFEPPTFYYLVRGSRLSISFEADNSIRLGQYLIDVGEDGRIINGVSKGNLSYFYRHPRVRLTFRGSLLYFDSEIGGW